MRPGIDPWVGTSPGEWKGYLLQYSGLGNSMDFVVHGVAKSQTWLSDFHFIIANYQVTFFFSKKLFWLCLMAWGILVPWSGIKPMPLQWKYRVLTTGLLMKSLSRFFFLMVFHSLLLHLSPNGSRNVLSSEVNQHHHLHFHPQYTQRHPLLLAVTIYPVYCIKLIKLFSGQERN